MNGTRLTRVTFITKLIVSIIRNSRGRRSVVYGGP
jgi:hypothetical protein